MKKNELKNSIGLILLAFFYFATSGFSQKSATMNSSDFNSLIDQNGKGASYEEKKADWVKRNPGEYQNWVKKNRAASSTLNSVESNSYLFPWGMDQNKLNWVNQNPEEYKQLLSIPNAYTDLARKKQLDNWVAFNAYVEKNKSKLDPDYQVIYHSDFVLLSAEKKAKLMEMPSKFLLMPENISRIQN